MLGLDDTVACWGNPADDRTLPLSGTFASVSAGGDHTCGLRTDGTLACWGRNTQSPPHNVAPVGTFTAVDAGNTPGTTWSCAIGSNAHIVWGYNAFGRTNSPPGFFSAIGAGGTHGCAAPHLTAPAPGALTVRELRLAPRSGRGRSTI
jgi:hypothetical protein